MQSHVEQEHMTYRCTNSACGWKGKRPDHHTHFEMGRPGWIVACPKCGDFANDLDFLERAAIREEAPMSRGCRAAGKRRYGEMEGIMICKVICADCRFVKKGWFIDRFWPWD